MKASTLFLLFSLVTWSPPLPAEEPSKATYKKFAEDILIGKDNMVHRWSANPTISLFNVKDGNGAAIFTAIVDQVNSAFAPHLELKPIGPGDNKADIKVVFCAPADYRKIAQSYGLKNLGHEDANGFSWYNPTHFVNRGLVMVTLDATITPEVSQRFALRALLHTLGLIGTSKTSVESILDESNSPNIELTAADRKLATFLYTHLPAGTPRANFAKIFDKSWGP